jgi:hypothetical protein
LLFAEISFVKHKEGKPGYFKQPLGAEIARHKLLPADREILKPSSLVKLVSRLRVLNHDMPCLANIENNDFQPVLQKVAENDQSEQEMVDALFIEMEKCNYSAPLICNEDGEEFLKSFIKIDWPTSQALEKTTRLTSQGQNLTWHRERYFRITASVARNVSNPAARTDPLKRFQGTRKSFTSRSVRHGIRNESVAMSQFLSSFAKRHSHEQVEGHCSLGLLVHPNFPHIGATLDRLIKVDGQLYAVEIKCPYNPFLRKQKLALKFKSKEFYVNLDMDGNPFLKPQHPYYHQVQTQLLVANLSSAVFVVFVPPDDIEYFLIERDDSFINNLLEELTDVYSNSLIPAFVKEVQDGLK